MSAKNWFQLKIGNKNEINSIGKCNKQNAHATIHSLQPNWLNAKVISQSISVKCSRTDRLYETVLYIHMMDGNSMQMPFKFIYFTHSFQPQNFSIRRNKWSINLSWIANQTFCCYILIQDIFDRVWSGKDLMSPPPYYYSLSYQTSQTFAFDQSSIINGFLLLSIVFTLVVVYAMESHLRCIPMVFFHHSTGMFLVSILFSIFFDS